VATQRGKLREEYPANEVAFLDRAGVDVSKKRGQLLVSAG
jgi:hypothetical protein